MEVHVSDSLSTFIATRVRVGNYRDAGAFISDWLLSEAAALDRIALGEPIEVDAHFQRRLEALLDEAGTDGEYMEATPELFDAMEADARAILARKGIT